MVPMKVSFDDFYKFLVSLGVLMFAVSVYSLSHLLEVRTEFPEQISFWIVFGLYVLIAVVAGWITVWGGLKWKYNQSLYDKKLEAETRISVRAAQEPIQSKDLNTLERKSKNPLISYKIDTIAQGGTKLDFPKLWFIVYNQGDAKYKAYFTTHFCADGKIIETVKGGHYGGKHAWHLNPNTMIRAPGLEFSQKVIDKNKKATFSIKVDCRITDEQDKVYEPFPSTFIYDKKNDNWYFEP